MKSCYPVYPKRGAVALIPAAPPGIDCGEEVSFRFDWKLQPNQLWLSASRKNQPSQKGLPGGKSDGDAETFRDTVCRETLEETGVTIQELVVIRADLVDDYLVTAFLVIAWKGIPRQMPGEGFVSWQTEEELRGGPFGEFNSGRFDDIRKFLDAREVMVDFTDRNNRERIQGPNFGG